MKVQPFQGIIIHNGAELYVKAFVMPTKHAPHVGFGSPRYGEPGHRAYVVRYELFDDCGEDVTSTVWLDSEIRAVQREILDGFAVDRTADALMREGVVA